MAECKTVIVITADACTDMIQWKTDTNSWLTDIKFPFLLSDRGPFKVYTHENDLYIYCGQKDGVPVRIHSTTGSSPLLLHYSKLDSVN